MRLNIFQYHVQNREYTKAEVRQLIENKPYKHLLLADSEFLYSTGTIFETIEYGFSPIKYAIDTVASGLSTIIKYSGKILTGRGGETINSYNTNSNNNDSYNTINNYYNSEHKHIDKEYYTGQEVAAFVNKFYDYTMHFNKDIYHDKIITNFLNHKYIHAEVPTLGDYSIFDIAVLDV